MKVLIGMTGSVASVLYKKIVNKFSELGDVSVVLTDKASNFISSEDLSETPVSCIYSDKDEWEWKKGVDENGNSFYKKGESILHIDLKNNSDIFVIAPCSANSLAKLANGISDSLLTSVARAWNFKKPIIIAPSCNNDMWSHPVTKEHINKLQNWGYTIVPPQNKVLACGDEGIGALADIDNIVAAARDAFRWQFPLKGSQCSGIPVSAHPGAFKAQRKLNVHGGVDLYCEDGTEVYACEDGRIVGHGTFTGASIGMPWWNETDYLLIEGRSGVICYGEINIEDFDRIKLMNLILYRGKVATHNYYNNMYIKKGQLIGKVKRVLPEGKERPDIQGHSCSMLHLELYPHGRYVPSDGENDLKMLIDPTPFLINAIGSPKNTLFGMSS
jgi:phosphopantothenoylcysteine decarboxylase